MPKILNINAQEDTPFVLLNPEDEIFVFSGRSLPEDAAKFYKPIFEWFELYVKSPNPITEITFDLDYFNSTSLKQIIKLIFLLEQLNDIDFKIKVVWIYSEGDEIMLSKGQEIESICKLPFTIVMKS